MRADGTAPFFSVIVPTYNRAPLIPRCIESVLTQTYRDFELIVADDGSTDNTPAIVQKYIDADSRVRYVRQENRGAGDARNLGASISTAGYLLFLDSDDEAMPHWLKSIRDEIGTDRRALICCGIEFRDKSGDTYLVRLPVKGEKGHPDLKGLFLSGTFAIERTVFERVGRYTEGLPANQHSELRFRLLPALAELDCKLKLLDEPLVTAHTHDLGKLRHDDRRVFESGSYILQQHRSFLMRDRNSFASWSASTGVAAARLGRFNDARNQFISAVCAKPFSMKNYGRVAITFLPLLRRWFWKSGMGAR